MRNTQRRARIHRILNVSVWLSWIAFLLLVALVEFEYRSHVLHPPFWPPAVLLFLSALGIAGSVIAGSVSVALAGKRLAAFSRSLAGMVPGALLAWPALHSQACWHVMQSPS